MLTFQGNTVLVNGAPLDKQVRADGAELYWRPCTQTTEYAVLLYDRRGKTYRRRVSWLSHPLYKQGDDPATVAAVNALFDSVLGAYKVCTPPLLFRYGCGEMHAEGAKLVDFDNGLVYQPPTQALVQRTGATATFDAAFFNGEQRHETVHVERRYFRGLLQWCAQHGCPVLDTASDPVDVEMVHDAILDLGDVQQVAQLLAGDNGDDSDESDWVPEEGELDDPDDDSPPRKRKRADV